jgi:hypothetical protein
MNRAFDPGAKVRIRLAGSIFALMAIFAVSFDVRAQTRGQKSDPAKNRTAAVPRRDLSGVWLMQPGSGGQGPGGKMPAMTAWGQSRFDSNKPGFGPRATPNGNDPILQCDPMGFPRILYVITPFEFTTIPGRMLMLFEHDHVWREIWTDGRSLPSDPDPTWYGHAVGRWADDYTFVVESTGYDERTWLSAEGEPNSDALRLEERYHRVDLDTIEFILKIDDPKVFTNTWVADKRILKRRPNTEILASYCVASEESSFKLKIREPAAEPGKNEK